MKKIISLLIVSVMAVAMLAGCGGTSGAPEKDDNVIVMATSADFEPYEYYENDEIVGIDIDIMNAVCEKRIAIFASWVDYED